MEGKVEHKPIRKMPSEAPERVRIQYARNNDTGLLCGYSDDFPGLNAYGKTIDEVNAELVELASAFAKHVFGAEARYVFHSEPESELPFSVSRYFRVETGQLG